MRHRAARSRRGPTDAGRRSATPGSGRGRRLAVRELVVILGLAAALGVAAIIGVSASSPPAQPGAAPDAGVSPVPSRAAPTPTPRPTPARAVPSVTIAAVGDTMLGNTPDLPPHPAAYFDAVKHTLGAGAQVVFGNLEGTLTTATTSKCGPRKSTQCFAFRDPPGYVRYFKDAGFTVLNNANNHSYDFGAAGQAQTVQTIRAAGLAQTGLPGEITVVRAGPARVAFVAFAPYDYAASLLDLPAAQALIRRASRAATIVVVYMHAGAEGSDADHVTGQDENYLGEDRGNPEAFAHMAIDAGASLVIASGPHVLRGLQFYHGHLIAYSLGNFAGYGDFSTSGDLDLSVILHVTLSAAGRFERARLYPVQFRGPGQPVPGGGAVGYMARLSAADFGRTAARVLPSGAVEAP
jgi:poly-gamma-glutamate capsule biosynthesis protein CapA/YwtB (metallophosphatase superfamily)